MPTTNTATELASLAKLVEQLQEERQQHLDAIAEIDETFSQLGIEAQRQTTRRRKRRRRRGPARAASRASSKPGRKQSSRKTATRKGAGRTRRKTTAEQFILQQLKYGRSLSTGELNERWTKSGRPGSANNTLSKMTQEGTLKRENIKGERGSRYSKPA